jgi:hypothetical protein
MFIAAGDIVNVMCHGNMVPVGETSCYVKLTINDDDVNITHM